MPNQIIKTVAGAKDRYFSRTIFQFCNELKLGTVLSTKVIYCKSVQLFICSSS